MRLKCIFFVPGLRCSSHRLDLFIRFFFTLRRSLPSIRTGVVRSEGPRLRSLEVSRRRRPKKPPDRGWFIRIGSDPVSGVHTGRTGSGVDVHLRHVYTV